jgi:AraC family transcriptional regulator
MNDVIVHNILSSENAHNGLRISKVKKVQQRIHFGHLSAKFVVDGVEHYTVNGQRFTINAGEYVLGNLTSEGQVLIDSKKQVKGICLDISERIIHEVTEAYEENFPKLRQYLATDEFLVNKYRSSETNMGMVFEHWAKHFEQLPQMELGCQNELFFTAAECIVRDQLDLHHQYYRLPSAKMATKADLLRKLLESKAYIHEHFSEKLVVEELARYCGISEFHYLRVFKQAFLLSPYQYVIQVRLEHSMKLLQRAVPASEVALSCGFADIQSFSKVFKNHFGVAPSRI